MARSRSPKPPVGAPLNATTIVSQLFSISGLEPNSDTFAATSTMGMIRAFAGDYTAYGAPNCLGQALPVASNPALFGLIGNRYGGDGQTYFALPDLRRRVVAGGEPGGPSGWGSVSMSYGVAVRADSLFAWPPLGAIVPYSGATLPGGWLPADGALLPIAQYSALFGVLGTRFGGDGATRFALPDLRGVAPIGTGRRALMPDVALGQRFAREIVWPVGALGLTYLICLGGEPPPNSSPWAGWLPAHMPLLGEVTAIGGANIPADWTTASGQLLPVAQHPALFALLGTRYGGDGQANFALPDMRGYMIAGLAS
jgi:microcystin-dependent protein